MFVVTEIIIKVIITDILLLVLKMKKFNSILLSYNVFVQKKKKKLYYIIFHQQDSKSGTWSFLHPDDT